MKLISILFAIFTIFVVTECAQYADPPVAVDAADTGKATEAPIDTTTERELTVDPNWPCCCYCEPPPNHKPRKDIACKMHCT